MKFTRVDIAGFAQEIVDFLDVNKIESIANLTEYAGRKIPIEAADTRFIDVSLRDASGGTHSVAVSYIIDGSKTGRGGIPIEARANILVPLYHFIIKFDGVIPDYTPFNIDPFGNTVQNRPLPSSKFSDFNSELERLAKE